MDEWDVFLDWAERLTDGVDLDHEERNYKVVVAERMATALGAARENSDEWPRLLKSALGTGNLVNQFAQTRLRNQLDSKPEMVRTAFVAFDDARSVQAIDVFSENLRSWGDSVTPGNITLFASLVLLSTAPAEFPPYRASFVSDWARLVGLSAEGEPRQRYETLLRLCDELVKRSENRSVAYRDRLDAQGLAWATLRYAPDVRWAPLEQARLSAWRDGQSTVDVQVPRGSGWSPSMETAAWKVLGAGLQGQDSAIAPGLRTWRADVAADLQYRIEHNPDFGAGTFLGKLEGQLAGASDEVIGLTAELLYIHCAPLSNVRASTKRKRIATVLGWTKGDYQLPDELADGLEADGSFNGGVGFNVGMWNQLTWLCRFVIHWLEQPVDRRTAALRDPLVFSEVSGGTPKEVSSMRYSLEYLAWPGVFPWVTSPDHRTQIVKAMASDFGGPTGTDGPARTRDLVSLRQFHQRQSKQDVVDWYVSPYAQRWWKGHSVAPRAWLVRPSDGGRELVQRWQDDGFVSLKAEMLGTVEAGASEPTVRALVRAGYNHVDRAQQEALTLEYYQFLTVMREDDLAVTIDHDQLLIGVVGGGPEFVEEAGSRLRRQVVWSNGRVERSELPDPVPSLLEKQGLVVDLTAAYDMLAAYIQQDVIIDDEPRPKVEPAVEVVPTLPPVTDEFAAELFMNRAKLQEIADLLQSRQQLVLYGPPGTGKTFLAQKLAKHLVGSEDPSRVRLVQFHPSYAYEDFFEGYRPTLKDGQATFELSEGPLRLLAGEASQPENRGVPFILIIDEMNRSNLAKVFGELYFLLEYRRETVRLQYQPQEPFRLPLNLFIIGTMNTADRSIALVDAAIRRRFPFYELHPGEEPVKSVLEGFMRNRMVQDDRVALLAELNEAIGQAGRDLHIGPSYLMRNDIDKPGGLDLVWRFDILPLLEEHFYGHRGRDEVRKAYGIEGLRARIARKIGGAAATPADEPVDEPEVGPDEAPD